MAQRKHSPGFRPRPSFHLPTPYVKPLEEGDKLTPHLDAEDEQEKAIAANPVTSGYVERYGRSATQPRVRYEAYSAGWEDAYAAFTAMQPDYTLLDGTGVPLNGEGTPLSEATAS